MLQAETLRVDVGANACGTRMGVTDAVDDGGSSVRFVSYSLLVRHRTLRRVAWLHELYVLRGEESSQIRSLRSCASCRVQTLAAVAVCSGAYAPTVPVIRPVVCARRG